MKVTIEIEFPAQISKQREADLKRIIAELKDEVGLYGGVVTKAELS